ncbi:MAG: hypothetical protein IT266_03180 [Saprospiraceae bacterium]|nr:hypothetical protein [Saprospiraceae bacterium]
MFSSLALPAVSATTSPAQEPEARTFTALDGMVHPQVTDLLKNSRGYIRVATKGGVSRSNCRQERHFDFVDPGLSQ